VAADAAPVVYVVVRVERFLRGAQRLRHVLQVHADSRPRSVAPSHRIDEHVGGLEMRRGLPMPRLPSIEARQRVLLVARTGYL
jgi:hypothetical protein